MLLDKKKNDLKESKSKLGFTTTGGDNWEIWDRFITIDNEQLFHIGNICGTCGFFFEQVKADIKTSYTVDEVRNILNNGVKKLEENLLRDLSTLFPKGSYEVLLLKIQPYMVSVNGENDYFRNEQKDLWNYDGKFLPSKGKYYRGTDRIASSDEKIFEFFIPLYQPDSLNEDQVQFYQRKIREGLPPTAIALSVIDAKECAYCSETPKDGIFSHWCFANYILDGHHKMQAAARENKPITLISFIAKDHSWKVVDELINVYKTTKQ